MRKCVPVRQSRRAQRGRKDFTLSGHSGTSCLDVSLKLWFPPTRLLDGVNV